MDTDGDRGADAGQPPAPVFVELDEVVVLGGRVAPPKPGAICNDMMVLHPVSVTLARPLGDRLLVDAVEGQLVVTRRLA